MADDAGGRQEVVERIFRGDATLDGVAARLQRAGVHPQGLALGDAQLLAYDVHAVHQLGDGVLDLESRVHLEEVELSGRGEQELDGAGAEVAHRAGGGGRRLAQAPPQRRSDRHGRRLLDQLLMTALDAALALAQRDDPAVGVGEHLHLDVAGALEVFLDVQLPRPERLQRLALRRLEGGLELPLLADQPHPFAAAAGDGLEEHRKP